MDAQMGNGAARAERAGDYIDNDRFEDQYAWAPAADIELRRLRAALLRNKWLIGGAVALGLAIGIVLALLSTPVYRATATIQIDQQGPQVFGESTDDLTGEKTDGDTYLATQVQILQSRSLVDRVASSLEYDSDVGFFEGMKIDAPEIETGSPAWNRAVASGIKRNLEVELMQGTRLVGISFESPTPGQAQRVANQFAEQFINTTLKRRFDTSSYSRQFLQEQIEETRQQLEASERALIDYVQREGITDVPSGDAAGTSGTNSLTAANLSALNSAYATARADRILAEQRWNRAAAAPTMSLPEVLNNPSIQAMQTQKAKLTSELQGERDRHSVQHPNVARLNAELEALDNQIEASAAQIRSSIREQYNLAVQQERDLRSDVNGLRQESLGEQGRSVQLSILRRDADTNRALYDALLQRYRELNAASGVTANNMSIIDKAELPVAPIWPKPLVNAVLGGLLGFILAVAIAFMRERLDDSIRAPGDVEEKLGLPLLGLIPMAKEDHVDEDLADPSSPISEAVYSLRSALQLSTQRGVPATLLITSASAGEGKSTTAYSIAREFAQSGKRTLLVDADLRRPSIHRYFPIKNDRGFSNLLVSEDLQPDLISQTDTPNLSVLSSGPQPPSPPRLLVSEVLQRVFATLSHDYDLLVLDGPPVMGLADALQLSAATEGTLFVVEAGASRQGQTKVALGRLRRAGGSMLGAVLTKFDFSKVGYSDYGYGDTYYAYSSSSSSKEA